MRGNTKGEPSRTPPLSPVCFFKTRTVRSRLDAHTNREPSPVGDRRVAGASKRPLHALEITGSFPPDDPERHRSDAAEQATRTDRDDCFISPTLRRAWPPRCGPRGRHMRSRYRCSMCSAIHINSRSWLRSSSTHEPSDPPLKVITFAFFCLSVFKVYCEEKVMDRRSVGGAERGAL